MCMFKSLFIICKTIQHAQVDYFTFAVPALAKKRKEQIRSNLEFHIPGMHW